MARNGCHWQGGTGHADDRLAGLGLLAKLLGDRAAWMPESDKAARWAPDPDYHKIGSALLRNIADHPPIVGSGALGVFADVGERQQGDQQ